MGSDLKRIAVSDVDTALRGYLRIHTACRSREVRDPHGGRRLSSHQASILSHLDDVDPTMVGELAEHVGVTPSTMSLTLKRLEDAGYVRRDRDPSDRRVMNVRLTDAGVRMRDAHTLLDARRVRAMLDMLAPADRAAALHGLRLLAGAAGALVGRDEGTAPAPVGNGGRLGGG